MLPSGMGTLIKLMSTPPASVKPAVPGPRHKRMPSQCRTGLVPGGRITRTQDYPLRIKLQLCHRTRREQAVIMFRASVAIAYSAHHLIVEESPDVRLGCLCCIYTCPFRESQRNSIPLTWKNER